MLSTRTSRSSPSEAARRADWPTAITMSSSGASMSSEPLLTVQDLKVRFPTEEGIVKAVDGISFSMSQGETLGVVGESGSGKSVTFLAIMGLLDRGRTQISGEATFQGRDLLSLDQEEMRSIRGDRIAMIFQDPLTSLNPVYRIGDQIAEVFLAHNRTDKKEAGARAVELLETVGIPKPKERARQYPHEFSGGMRQRVMIAMALALNPSLLIADEPTTALDVTVQAQILDLIDALKTEFRAAVVLITHDLGVVAEHCDYINVMYAGRIAESGPRDDIYYASEHPYTWGLLGSISRLDGTRDRLNPIKGLPPSLINVPSGCPFHPRCPHVMDICKTEVPRLLPVDGNHASACHLPHAERLRIFEEKVAIR
jgi:peptide/nickel transport system ATP-binding protein